MSKTAKIIELINSNSYLTKISAFKLALQDLRLGKESTAKARIRNDLDKVVEEEDKIILREFVSSRNT